MPFQSEKQRRYLWANEPEIARDWADTYGSRIKKDDGGISQLVKSGPGRPGYAGRNFMGDYDPQNTTGWQQSGQVETHVPGGGGATTTSFDTTSNNPSYDPNATGKVNRITADQLEERNIQERNLLKGDKPKYLPEFLYNRNKKFFINKVLGSKNYTNEQIRDLLEDDETLESMYSDWMSNRKAGTHDAYGNRIGAVGGEGGYMGYPSYEAWAAAQNRGTGVTEVAEVIEEDTPSAFQQSIAGGPQLQYADYGTAAHGRRHNVDERMFSANGGRIPAAYGGIMDTTTGRRAYGLGSIGKVLGKAAKAVGIIEPSPLVNPNLLKRPEVPGPTDFSPQGVVDITPRAPVKNFFQPCP